jgi:predicted GTPase
MSADSSDDDDDDDDHEADDDDDGEDEVRPLDPHAQKRPKLPIYHPGFKLTEELTRGMLSIFVEFFQQARKGGYHDDETQHLWNEVMKSKIIPYQDAVKLAVAGDTGAGKSALLNAILGVLNLTIEVREAIQHTVSQN